MKKRVVACFLALVLLLSLAACGGKTDLTDGTGSDGSDRLVSVTDTGSGESSDASVFSSGGTDSGVTDSLSDVVTDSGTDVSGEFSDASETDSGEEEDVPSDDFSQNGEDAPDADGGDETDVYLPDYVPSTDSGGDASVPSTDKNTATSSRNTGTSTNGGTSDTSDVDSNEVVGDTLQGLMAITDQKNGAIAVVDLSKNDITSSEALVWEWNPRMHGDVNYRSGDKHLDDVVIREVHGGLFNGTVVGITSSSGLIAVVEYPSGKCLFNVSAAGYGPHDIEILPNGLVAVACSGNSNSANTRVRIYRARTKNDQTCTELSNVASTHGILWDPEEDVLWVLGNNVLNAYRIGGSPSSAPTITLVSGKGVSGFSGGHCLSPVYGNSDRLWISTGSSVCQFSKSDNRLYTDFSGASRISGKAVKSVNNFANGTVIWTVADANNGTATHNTDTVQMWYYKITASGKRVAAYKAVKFSDRDFYKVRVFDTAYQ